MCDTRRAVVSRPRWGALYGATVPPLVALAVVEVAAPPNVARTALRLLLGLGAFAVFNQLAGGFPWHRDRVVIVQPSYYAPYPVVYAAPPVVYAAPPVVYAPAAPADVPRRFGVRPMSLSLPCGMPRSNAMP